MAYVEPNGDIYLIRCDLDPSYENTYRWAAENTAADRDYFFIEDTHSVERLHLTDYSYIRKLRNVIKVELGIGTVSTYNYMAFRNTDFMGKWFYAFITDVEYVNNNTSQIYFELDVIQTYYTNAVFNDCLIERQHSETDGIGDNLIDEGLETGEYVISGTPNKQDFRPVVVVAYTEEWDAAQNPPKFMPVVGHLDDGINDASYYTACKYEVFNVTLNASEVTRLNTFIEKYTEKNKINAILSIFIGAGEIFDSPHFQTIQESVKINGEYNIDGYTDIKNKKLLTFPFNFLQVSNFHGDAIDYRYEFFDDPENIEFDIWGNTSTSPGLMLYPYEYKGVFINWEEIVVNNSFPQCCYTNDTYKAWLAQNRGSLVAGALGSAAAIASGISVTPGLPSIPFTDMGASSTLAGTGAKVGFNTTPSVVGGIIGAAALLGKMYDHSTLPPTAHGNGNGDLMYQADLGGFGIYHKTITAEFAKRIDDFFQMFGYKQGKVGKPNLFARAKWVYVKTAGASIHGEMPSDDIRKIEAIYNKGIRFWDKSATFGDYSQTNPIYTTPSSTPDPTPTPTPTNP